MARGGDPEEVSNEEEQFDGRRCGGGAHDRIGHCHGAESEPAGPVGLAGAIEFARKGRRACRVRLDEFVRVGAATGSGASTGAGASTEQKKVDDHKAPAQKGAAQDKSDPKMKGAQQDKSDMKQQGRAAGQGRPGQ